MNKKIKRNVLLMTGLAGSLIASSVAGVALSSCTTTSSTLDNNVQYSYVIDWSDPNVTDRLTIDSNGLVYSDSSKTTIIATSPSISLNTITIPSSVKNITGYAKVVTNSNGVKTYQSVGAFQDNTLVTSIVLESGSNLQSIGSLAFSGCTNLISISGLSNSLTFIGSNAFTNCTNLTSIDLSKVLNIGEYAFQNCSSLAISGLNKVLAIGQYAFDGALDETTETTLDLSSVTSIGQYAFNNSNVFAIDLSNNTNLNTIGKYAFYGCTKLKGTVDLSGCSNLSAIPDSTFYGCTSLVTVYIPSSDTSSLTTIGANAFSGCTSMTTFGPKGTAAGSLIATSTMSSIGSSAFADTIITTVNAADFDAASSNGTTGSNGSFKNMHYVTAFTLPTTMKAINYSYTEGLFQGVGDLGEGFDLVLPSSINDFFVITDTNTSAFAGSGVRSVDMSQITSYEPSNTNSLPPSLFSGATKLQTVILRPGTTQIEYNAFYNCTSLRTVAIPSSSTEKVDTSTAGFIAPSTLTTIQGSAFYNAFAEDANAVIDLSAATSMTTVNGFQNSKIASAKLPTSTVTIDSNAFQNTTKLSSVNFADLTNLTTISTNNFSNSLLTDIDLSNTQFKSLGAGAFTGLSTEASVSFPTTLSGNFSGAFTDTNGNYIKFNFPKGMNSNYYSISNGVLSLTSNNVTNSIGSVNLTNVSTINSIGVNSFFGNTNLTSVTTGASGITSSTNIFTGSASLAANTNKTTVPSTYLKANLPFGSNSSFTSLNYTNFSTTASDTTTAQALFERTNATTWTAVAKIINSLSNYTYAEEDGNNSGANIPANLSSWTPVTSGTTTKTTILTDSTATFTAATTGSSATAAKVVLNNSFAVDGATTGDITIQSTDTTTTFIHNGITWTYTNDGTNITLTGEANMYKATNTSGSFLTFFNNEQATISGSTYNIPSQTKVAVTLTIATKTSS